VACPASGRGRSRRLDRRRLASASDERGYRVAASKRSRRSQRRRRPSLPAPFAPTPGQPTIPTAEARQLPPLPPPTPRFHERAEPGSHVPTPHCHPQPKAARRPRMCRFRRYSACRRHQASPSRLSGNGDRSATARQPSRTAEGRMRGHGQIGPQFPANQGRFRGSLDGHAPGHRSKGEDRRFQPISLPRRGVVPPSRSRCAGRRR